MRFSVKLVSAFALAATFAVATTVSASAECKRYGFTVNDYGKDGPTKDAKELLDKLIQSKMTERGVSDYRTGKKSVSCEMFLNFIVFDEHTCTAEATVCWGGSTLPSSEQSAVDDPEPAKKTAADTAPAEEKPAKKSVTKEAAHADTATPAAPVAHKTAAQSVPDPKSLLAHKAKKTEEKKQVATAPAQSSEATPSEATVKPINTTSKVETGSLADVPAKPVKHKTQKAAVDAPAAAPAKADADDAGYPTPLPPQDGADDAK
ncbi:hypothetical protein [Hyphomicrobium sp. 99]|uniref:hypothetical protein n=1 Tax=Hyphomicrobium sp. 99 TaxID=1163419 RepID=UPI0005F798A4|nr:hypothetical protein [Hyphomicrobium sp. 99]